MCIGVSSLVGRISVGKLADLKEKINKILLQQV